jgi:TolB protein
VIFLLVVNLIVLGAMGIVLWWEIGRTYAQRSSNSPTSTLPLVVETSEAIPAELSEENSLTTETPSLSSQSELITLSSGDILPTATQAISLTEGLILLGLDEGGYTHLFAYQPVLGTDAQPLGLVRLMDGPWNDVQPALSPDSKRIAFASDRSGYWDIYLLDLSTGVVTRVTDNLEYDSAPSWSPDGHWLVYETYIDENLELVIFSVEDRQPPIRLTSDGAADHSPTWSPHGRQIAFVSTRSGESEIWLADLDKPEEERFENLSQNASGSDTHPAWSPDGSSLAWVGFVNGFRNLYLHTIAESTENPVNAEQPPARKLGNGDWPAWSPDGKVLLSTLSTPNQIYLTAYPVDQPGLVLSPLPLPGVVNGLVWGHMNIPLLLHAPYQQAAAISPTPLWLPSLTAEADQMGGRYALASLEDVDAPYALLHDQVDESFQALRNRLAFEIGWDFLSALENAYVPLTDPLAPGMGEDWLYTGRAFAFNQLPLSAGWVVVMKEDYGSQTEWRIYVRTTYQDGSAGVPLHELPWDFNARLNGDTEYYEQGGKLSEIIPPGYWFDFTNLAIAYGWERQPALSTWRAAFTTARFNEFVQANGNDWHSAMLELYPPEALITSTAVLPPTRTPTPTPRWYQSPTPTLTPTNRPTFTPITPSPTDIYTPTLEPTNTLRPTATARPSQTPSPSSTLTPFVTQTPPTITPSLTLTPGG